MVLVVPGNVGQHKIVECSELKPILILTVSLQSKEEVIKNCIDVKYLALNYICPHPNSFNPNAQLLHLKDINDAPTTKNPFWCLVPLSMFGGGDTPAEPASPVDVSTAGGILRQPFLLPDGE